MELLSVRMQVADDENAEVETDENGVEITCLSPLQQSAFRCRQELGASKSLPALLQATKEQLQQSEECVIDQVDACTEGTRLKGGRMG